MIVWGFLELMTAAFADLQHNKTALFIHSNSASKKKVYLSQILPHNFVLKCLPKIFNKKACGDLVKAIFSIELYHLRVNSY